MSITIETIITCDGNSTSCMGNDWGADYRHKNATQQRETARRELGWRCVRGKDYCPQCWKHLYPQSEK